MVYRGQPSPACAGCRSRRTKCDGMRPSCSQCIRSGRQCMGYRELADMMFRDETKAVAAKSERKARKKQEQRHSPPESPKTREPCDLITGSAEASPREAVVSVAATNGHPVFPSTLLWASAEEQATCFFFRNYVWDNQEFKNGNFQYLPDIYAIRDSSPVLADCIVAVGLAGLANFWKASSVMARAHAKYNSGIRCVSSMLAANDTVRSDQTLVAVILLGLYETNTCSGPQSMKSWTKHINGATTILQMRGKHQLSNPLGRQIFSQLRTQIIINCVLRRVKVPDIISKWSRISLLHESPVEAQATKLAFLCIQLAQLRASMPSLKDFTDSAFVVVSMSALDTEYAQWASECPPEFSYVTVPLLEPSADVFGHSYEVHSSMYTASLWNLYRSMRILINQMIGDQLSFHLKSLRSLEGVDSVDTISDLIMIGLGLQGSSASSSPSPPGGRGASAISNLCLSAKTKVLTLSQDICASVPYFLSSSPSPSSSSLPKTACGNLLIWPLYTAACTWMVSDVMREWVAARLASIADTMGIRQAWALAHSLRMMLNIKTLEWKDEPFGYVSRVPVTLPE